MDVKQSSFEVSPDNNINDIGIMYIRNDVPIEQESQLLVTLDDDCLREVFKYLPLLDLSNCAEVCIRFNQHANDAFNAKYKHVMKIDQDFDLNVKPGEMESVLRNFGPLIHSLSISRTKTIFPDNSTSEVAIRMINQHTTTTALKELHLSGVVIGEFLENLGPVFLKLDTFKLDSCVFMDGAENLFGQAFPTLTQAQFKCCSGLNYSALEKFITLNPRLQTLMIGMEYWTDGLANLIHLIGGNLSNLVELEVDTFDHPNEEQLQECATSIGKLTRLKVLKYKCTEEFAATALIYELAKQQVPIEHLQLMSGRFDGNTMKSLTQLKQIKILELQFIADLTERHIIEMAKELPLLETFRLKTFQFLPNDRYLSVDGLVEMIKHAKNLSAVILNGTQHIKININNYRTMLKAVHERSEKNHLSMEISSGQVDVSEDILFENRNWLSIKMQRKMEYSIFGGFMVSKEL